jgi:nitroreductase/dihydropteridine reductase
MSTLTAMQWRYATKKFDREQPLTADQVHTLMETVRLSPSSFGLQPYRLINVENPETRERIKQAAMGQPQISDGSHLIVFAVDKQLDVAAVASFIDNAAATRKLPRESLAARETQIAGAVTKLEPKERTAWAQKQAYLALGVLVAAAAEAGIDACPMEGFDVATVDAILGLDKLGLTATVFAVLGHRAADDPMAALAKVRKPLDQLLLVA